MARVISDPTNNVVLNFLKWNRACRASRCWVLESYFDQYPPHPPAQPGPTKPIPITDFDLAWTYCREPFWMLWALDKFYDPGFQSPGPGLGSVDGTAGVEEAQAVARTAVENVSAILTGPAQNALTTLQAHMDGPPPGDAAAMAQARATAKQESDTAGASGVITAASRAHAALLALFDCADANDYDAADVAWGLATEASLFTQIYGLKEDWRPWTNARKNLAYNQAHANDIYSMLDITSTGWQGTPGHVGLRDHLANKYKAPPPWSVNTNHTPNADPLSATVPVFITPEFVTRRKYFRGIFAPPATTPPSNWSGSSLKGGTTVWSTYGSDDDGTPTNRSSWVTDTNGHKLQEGTVVPPSGDFNWAFQYTGLTVNQTVVLYVQWTYSGPTTVTDNVTVVVAPA
jgi:hypothetical protein